MSFHLRIHIAAPQKDFPDAYNSFSPAFSPTKNEHGLLEVGHLIRSNLKEPPATFGARGSLNYGEMIFEVTDLAESLRIVRESLSTSNLLAFSQYGWCDLHDGARWHSVWPEQPSEYHPWRSVTATIFHIQSSLPLPCSRCGNLPRPQNVFNRWIVQCRCRTSKAALYVILLLDRQFRSARTRQEAVAAWNWRAVRKDAQRYLLTMEIAGETIIPASLLPCGRCRQPVHPVERKWGRWIVWCRTPGCTRLWDFAFRSAPTPAQAVAAFNDWSFRKQLRRPEYV